MKSFRTILLLFVSLCIHSGACKKAAPITITPPQQNNALMVATETFLTTIKSARRHLLAAAAARSTSIFCMYPVDTIKTRMQMGSSLVQSIKDGNMFRGVGGSLAGQVPYGVLTFGSYEVYKQVLLEKLPNVKPVFVYALAAIMGDVTGSGWLCPSEVIKQQLQAGMYSSFGDAAKQIYKKQGLGGFYQGYVGGLSRDIPFRVAQLCSYEVVKSIYVKAKQRRGANDVDLSPAEAATVGAIAGSFSAAITAPLDKIKTLLMTNGTKYGGSVTTCAASIIKNEGISGLFAGLVPRVTYIAPSVTIFFVVYELVQQRLQE